MAAAHELLSGASVSFLPAKRVRGGSWASGIQTGPHISRQPIIPEDPSSRRLWDVPLGARVSRGSHRITEGVTVGHCLWGYLKSQQCTSF